MKTLQKQHNFYAFRKRLNLTQKQIAEAIGVHIFTVRRWERNQGQINLNLHQLKNLYVLLKKVGYPFEQFLEDIIADDLSDCP